MGSGTFPIEYCQIKKPFSRKTFLIGRKQWLAYREQIFLNYCPVTYLRPWGVPQMAFWVTCGIPYPTYSWTKDTLDFFSSFFPLNSILEFCGYFCFYSPPSLTEPSYLQIPAIRPYILIHQLNVSRFWFGFVKVLLNFGLICVDQCKKSVFVSRNELGGRWQLTIYF